MGRIRGRQRLARGTGRWSGPSKGMVVGNVYGRLGNSALSSLAEERGIQRSLVTANAGKASLSFAAEVLEYHICYLKCEPLDRAWSKILLHFFLFIASKYHLDSRDTKRITFSLHALP